MGSTLQSFYSKTQLNEFHLQLRWVFFSHFTASANPFMARTTLDKKKVSLKISKGQNGGKKALPHSICYSSISCGFVSAIEHKIIKDNIWKYNQLACCFHTDILYILIHCKYLRFYFFNLYFYSRLTLSPRQVSCKACNVIHHLSGSWRECENVSWIYILNLKLDGAIFIKLFLPVQQYLQDTST